MVLIINNCQTTPIKNHQVTILGLFVSDHPVENKALSDTLFCLPSFEECLHHYLPLLSETPSEHSIILDSTYLKKMDVFGKNSSVFNAINNTKTAIGALQLALQLATPSKNIEQLNERQNLVKALSDHQDINTLLAKIAQQEPALLHFFDTQTQATQKYINQYFFGKRLQRFNKNPVALQALVGGNYLSLAKQFLIVPYCCLLGRYSLNTHHKLVDPLVLAILKKGLDFINTQIKNFSTKTSDIDFFNYLLSQKNIIENNITIMENNIKNASLSLKNNVRSTFKDIKILANVLYNPCKTHNDLTATINPKTLGDIIHGIYSNQEPSVYYKRALVGGMIGAGIGVAAYQLYNSYRAVKNSVQQTEVFNHLHQHMIKIADCIRTVDQLSTVINNDALLSTLDELKPITHFRRQLSAEAQRLITLLETNTFNRSTPTVMSLSGRVLAAYALMQELKHEFIALLQAIGMLDAYMSTTHLINKTAQYNGDYTFAHYSAHNTPYLYMNNFWNPLIDSNKTVSNSIEFGANSAQNSILTGPNTAGKTTTLRSIILNAHLAQTIGICAAQQVTLTPFSSLNCYINVTDDLAKGISLFKAEVLRAKSLLKSIQSLGDNEFALTLIDEMFSGTAAQEGEQAAYAFAKKMGLFDNSIAIFATHYPTLTNLADERSDVFANYCMTAWKDQQGWHRPFTIQPGISTLNVAAELLEEEGVL